MGLYDDNSTVKQWLYKAQNVTLRIPGEGNTSIPVERVKGIQIIEEYEQNVFPIFKLTLVLEPSVYYKILKNKEGVEFTVRVDRFSQRLGSDSQSNRRPYINGRFQLIMNDNTEDLQYSQKLTANASSYSSSIASDVNDLQKVDNTVDFFLYKTDSVDGTKSKNTNVILKDATVTDAMSYLATRAGLKDVLMTTPQNQTKYEQILIPPCTTLKAFQYLDTYYGMYKSGTMTYFGLDRTYILQYSGACTAWSEGENKSVNVVIPKADNVKHSSALGELDRGGDQQSYYVGDYNTLDISNVSVANNYISGNDSQVLDSYSGGVTTSQSNAVSKDKNFIRTMENRTENKYLGDMYTAQSAANSVVVSVNLQDENAADITPNKEFKIVFEDTKYTNQYKGQYMPTKVVHNFLNTGSSLSLNSSIELRKTDQLAKIAGAVPGVG